MDVNNKITIVIVIYNSSNVIFDCLKFLDNFNIIIVDNGKNSKILDQLQLRKNITVISPGKNIGMGRGANFAFQSIKTDFFLLLSPDTKIDEDSILKLIITASKYDNKRRRQTNQTRYRISDRRWARKWKLKSQHL